MDNFYTKKGVYNKLHKLSHTENAEFAEILIISPLRTLRPSRENHLLCNLLYTKKPQGIFKIPCDYILFLREKTIEQFLIQAYLFDDTEIWIFGAWIFPTQLSFKQLPPNMCFEKLLFIRIAQGDFLFANHNSIYIN